jgi:hypothetical protein
MEFQSDNKSDGISEAGGTKIVGARPTASIGLQNQETSFQEARKGRDMNRIFKSFVWRALPVLMLSIGVIPTAKAQGANVAARETQTFPLTNATEEDATRQFNIALRNILDPRATVTFVPGQHSL